MIFVVMKIFLPKSCLTAPPGVLLGFWTDSKDTCVVCGTQEGFHRIKSNQAPSCNGTSNNNQVAILGLWMPGESPLEKPSCLPEQYIVFSGDEQGLPSCKVIGSKHGKSQVYVVLFDAEKFKESIFLYEIPQYQPKLEVAMTAGTIDEIARGLAHAFPKSSKHKIEDFTQAKRRYTVPLIWVMEKMLLLVYFVSDFFGRLADKMNGEICAYINWCCNIPAVTNQIRWRMNEMRKIKSAMKQGPKGQLCCRGLLCVTILDILMGMALMLTLMDWNNTHILASFVMSWAQNVAEELHNYLNWMMGEPGGMKLNHQLASFLSNFFLYHIYLWRGYLKLIGPVVGDLFWYISLTGCLGLSFQLCLIQDVISMLSLHIYCFYIYAARLYYFMIFSIASLWRIFRGKKWNVLRERVDSASYDVEQLFIGTLFLTILVFLLPTMIFYCVVFTALRLTILLVQGVLQKTVDLVNKMPVYGLILRIFAPHILSDEIQLTVLTKQKNGPLYFMMRSVPASLSTISKACTFPTEETHQKESVLDFLKRILTGQLMYPWIKQGL